MRYQKIESKIWNDEKFLQLTPLQQRLFFYVLTSPHGNILGLFVLKEGYVCEDLKCSPKDFRKDFESLIKIGLINYDPSVCLVFIKNFLIHNPITNPNQVIAAERTIKELPRSSLLLMIKGLIKGLNEELLEERSEGCSKPYSYSYSYSSASTTTPTPSNGTFERFWSTYPKKKSKGQAEKAWDKLKPDEQLLERILSKIEQAKISVEWTKDGGQYIPHPATWLNSKGWEDEYSKQTLFKPQPGIAAFMEDKNDEG